MTRGIFHKSLRTRCPLSGLRNPVRSRKSGPGTVKQDGVEDGMEVDVSTRSGSLFEPKGPLW